MLGELQSLNPRGLLLPHPQTQGFGQGSVFQGSVFPLLDLQAGVDEGQHLLSGHAGWKLWDFSLKSVCQGQAEAWWVHLQSQRGFILECESLPQARECFSGSEASQQESFVGCCPFCPGHIPGNAISGKLPQFWILICFFSPFSHSLAAIPALSQSPGVLGGCSEPHPAPLLPVWVCCWGILGCFLLGMAQGT